MENNKKNFLATGLLAGSVLSLGALQANATNLLSYQDLGSGSQVRAELLRSERSLVGSYELSCGEKKTESKAAEQKCGEGKCGENKAESKAAEHKCGEGKCGENKAESKAAEHKCGEGKCGEGKCGAESKSAEKKAESKSAEHKCGEGKCGEAKKK